MTPSLETFAEALAQDATIREADLAVAFIWFLGQESGHADQITAREAADLVERFRLRPKTNVSRLASNLRKHPDLVFQKSGFRVKASRQAALDQRFAAFFDPKNVPVSDMIVDSSLSLGGRGHLEQLRREINGCFDRGYYNASATMCRRLTELLLIEAFSKSGHLQAILDASGDIQAFGELVGIANSRRFLRLSRGAGATLEKVKTVGDAAAHHRHYMTRETDLVNLNPKFMHLLVELAAIAGL